MATWKEKYNKKYQYKKNKSHNLSDISKDTGVSRSGLQKIYNKGIGAYKTNPQSVRPNVTSKEQWAMARVYSSVMGGKASKIDKKELNMEKGGSTDFNPDGNIKDKVVHASGDAGGMLVGKRHSNGGIKALNKSTGQPLEMEGGEVVITRNAVSDNKKRSFNGKMMTNRQILSSINESGGGVSFADGGQVPNDVKFDCNAEYEYGGKTMCGKDLAYALGGDVYAKGGKVEDDEWKSIVSKFLNEFYGDYEDDTWEDYVDSDSVESIQTKYKKTSGRYDREVSFEEAYQTFKSSLTPKELKSIEVSFDEGEYADAEEHDEDKNWNSITIRKVGTYAKGGTIECGSCSWSWDRKDGGDDMYVCHKCGTDNTNEYKNGGITINNNNNNMKKNNLIKPKRKGKNIMTLAKEIRKKDESWQDALKRAKIEMNKTSSKKSSNIDSELGKLKELIKEDEILKEYNYSKKNTKKSNTRLQKGGDVMSLGIANADAVYNKGGKLSKDDAITKALKLGVDFNKDFHSQSFGNELSELAKETGYRKSKSSSGSLGRSFFNHLQKIYDKNSSYYDSTLNSRGYAKGGEIETKREFVEVVNQVKEENEALPNDFVNVMDSINAILQDRGYEEDDEYTYDVRQEILDRYEEKVLDKQGLRFAKGGELNVGKIVTVTTKDGKKYKGKVEKTNPLKLRTDPTSTVVLGNHLINKIDYAKGGKFAKGGLTYMPKESGMVDYMTKKPILKDERFVVYFEDKGKPISSSIKIAKSKRGAERINSRLVKSEEFNNNDYTLIMQSMDSFYKEYPNLFAKGGKTDDKGRKYADGGTIGEYPRVYIADLEAYNNGELKGEWLDLADYNDSEEFNDAVQDLLDGWGVEEYAIHDVENFPDGMYSEYMGTSDFDEIYDMIELAKNNDLPLDVVMEVVSQYDESAVEEYQGQYEDGEDFAYQMIDEIGLENFNNPQYFVDISDTDRRIMAQEMADSYVDDIVYEDDGERVVEEAGLDVDEYRELDGEDDDKRDEILEEAKEIVRDEYYETWYDGLDDPYDFLVNEQGFYSDEDFFKANFIQIDYGELANALEQDYLFIENDKGLFVFNVR